MNRSITFLLDEDVKDHTRLAYCFKRAFESNGYKCELIALNVNRYVNKATSYIPSVNAGYLAGRQKKVLRKLEKADSKWIFVIKGYYLLPSTIDEIKTRFKDKIIFCFNPDDPFSASGSSNNLIKESIGHYHAYFIWHRKLIQPIKDAGCKNVYYLPFAADTEIIKPAVVGIASSIGKDYAVSFIGNPDKKRTEFMGKLSDLLRGWNKKKAVFGYKWQELEGFDCNGQVVGKTYLNTMYRSEINLNILRNQNENSHNMRTFEIPAAGAFMLHEYSDEAAGFFEEGVEAEFFRDEEECADKIKFYYDNDELRRKIAKAGYEKIFSAGYTYINLAKEIDKNI